MLARVENEKILNNESALSKPQVTVLDIVSRDLNVFLDQGYDRQNRLNFLSRKLDIHKKTLQRIATKENRPSYATIIKLYRFLLNVEMDYEVFERVDPLVKSFLEKINPQKETVKQNYRDEDLKFFSENSLALAIYIQASVKKMSRSEIKRIYGEFGMRLAEQMLENGFISEISPDVFFEGRKKISFTPEMITKAGTMCAQNYAKPVNAYERNKNYIAFYAESLNADAYQEWILIDQEAYVKKLNLASKKESKGDIPVFTFNITETLVCED